MFCQDNLYKVSTIPSELLKNANAVIRSSDVSILIESSSDMRVTEKRIVTVLNKKGNNHVDAEVYYDENIKIKELQVLIFDASGNQINKIKEKDFKDVSAVDGGTLYSDSRVKYLEYTPISYPYTVEFTTEITNKNTAFIPSFMPLNSYFISVQNSSYIIKYPFDFTIRSKKKNLESIDLNIEKNEGVMSYELKNIGALKPEQYSPPLRELLPVILFASNEFQYEGVNAKVNDWNSMGKWFNDNLLSGRSRVNEETKNKVLELVKGVDDPIERAKLIYKYVQDNTRYISVQVGIGGMQPISAKAVDDVKYGDCKGLTNYTKSLLEIVGVKSYYTRLYASSSQQISVDKDFVSFGGQTNHVILNIPNNEENIWLECTSQKLPFGFIGDFTDDRDVLVITPEGGKIEHTKKYSVEENLQVIKGNCQVANNGGISARVNIKSKGIQYDNKYWLETQTERDLDTHYKEQWPYINSVKVNNMNLENDKNRIEFIEDVSFQAANYAKKVGNRLLFAINVLNRNKHVPDRYRDREFPLKVNRGFTDVDEIEISLPQDYKVEALPKNTTIENKFGSYNTEIIVKDESTLIYKREFIINDGEFPKEDYSSFRSFYKEVSKQDNAKIALIKK
jgi:transglutaminase-like putative cysteine protease